MPAGVAYKRSRSEVKSRKGSRPAPRFESGGAPYLSGISSVGE
jgi:hypothetical protein